MFQESSVFRYVVTLRLEPVTGSGGIPEWRGQIRNVMSGEQIHFRHIDGFHESWREITKGITEPGKSGSTTESNLD